MDSLCTCAKMIWFNVGTKEQIRADVSHAQMWGIIKVHIRHTAYWVSSMDAFRVSSHANMWSHLSLHVKTNAIRRYKVLYSPVTHVIFFPHRNWNEWYGKGFRGNRSPVYSALMQTILHAHTHCTKWLTLTAVTSCWGGWGGGAGQIITVSYRCRNPILKS